jgi:hypothetical protein
VYSSGVLHLRRQWPKLTERAGNFAERRRAQVRARGIAEEDERPVPIPSVAQKPSAQPRRAPDFFPDRPLGNYKADLLMPGSPPRSSAQP